VFWKILEIVDTHQPKAIVLENVKNLSSHDDGKTFRVICESLEERGYHVKSKVLDTSKITGVPQHRERIYIIAVQDKAVNDALSLEFPTMELQSIESMLSPAENIPVKYYYTSESTTWPLLSENVVKENVVYQYRRVYVRENKSHVCPTLTANMGTGGHNVPIIKDSLGIRKITPRECFNFQGFPDDYILPSKISDCHLYKLAGNAVSLPVVQMIADRLIDLLM
jgi:DNA (cytosine-5)-methyltransferase 1